MVYCNSLLANPIEVAASILLRVAAANVILFPLLANRIGVAASLLLYVAIAYSSSSMVF